MKLNKSLIKNLIIVYVCIFGILVSLKHFLTCFSSYDPRESLAIEIGFSTFWLFLHAPLPIALIDAFGVSERIKSDSVNTYGYYDSDSDMYISYSILS